MQVILLERVSKLGQMGDVVDVKPGYARNFLFPNNMALRENKKNTEKIYNVGDIENITDKNQFKKLRAETDSEALKKRFSDRKLLTLPRLCFCR